MSTDGPTGRPEGGHAGEQAAGPALLACALGAEAWALRAGLRRRDAAPLPAPAARQPVRLLRTGMGPVRARRSVSDALAHAECAPRALVYAGFGASVHTGLLPAEVLVADEVRDTLGTVARLPGADRAAAALRAAGLVVHTGVLHTADHVVRGAERGLLREAGVTGVDMETAAALRAAPPGLPVLAVRVIVDTPDHELVRPHTVRNGIRAWRTLRTAARVLADHDHCLEELVR